MQAEPTTVSRTHSWVDSGYLVLDSGLTESQRQYLSGLDIRSDRLRQPNDLKRLWMIDEETCRVACSERMMKLLDDLLPEQGYFLWGAQLIDRLPGQDHPWHCDIETWSAGGGFVSIWIGIHGTAASSSLHVVPGSHRYPDPLQRQLRHDDPARGDPLGKRILELAKDHDESAGVQIIEAGDGSAIVFDGRLWHGSFNRLGGPRRALLLQYGRHGNPVRRIKDHRAFPFQLDEEVLLPVLPLRGTSDPTTNHNIARHSGGFGFPLATIAAHPTPLQSEQPWTPTPYFRVATPILQDLTCHASILKPGFMPHLPHVHPQEEILITLEGHPTILRQDERSDVLRAHAASPGDIHYYPADCAHSIFNNSGSNVRYLMLRWTVRSPGPQRGRPFSVPSPDFGTAVSRPFLDRPASGLDHLHVHFTRLSPGEVRRRHVDCHDTAILVLEGELSVMNRNLGPGGVFLARAGELHDTCNRSHAPCAYWVFEFHATKIRAANS